MAVRKRTQYKWKCHQVLKNEGAQTKKIQMPLKWKIIENLNALKMWTSNTNLTFVAQLPMPNAKRMDAQWPTLDANEQLCIVCLSCTWWKLVIHAKAVLLRQTTFILKKVGYIFKFLKLVQNMTNVWGKNSYFADVTHGFFKFILIFSWVQNILQINIYRGQLLLV